MGLKEETKEKMEAAIDHLKSELKNIRTGRASPGLIDHVNVEVYGTQMKLKEIANISAPEPRSLLVTPFDASVTNTIGKRLEKENLGFSIVVEANLIRLNIPPMTQEVRDTMCKRCREEKEKARISVRNIRRDANEEARKQKTNGDIAEDQLKKLEKQIQELTDHYCKEAEQIADKKESEISTI